MIFNLRIFSIIFCSKYDTFLFALIAHGSEQHQIACLVADAIDVL